MSLDLHNKGTSNFHSMETHELQLEEKPPDVFKLTQASNKYVLSPHSFSTSYWMRLLKS